MTDLYTETLKEVTTLISIGNLSLASSLINEKYPFEPVPKVQRKYTPREMTKIFLRDGFIDRYKGTKLVYPPALRIISHYLPIEFPYHKNSKMTEGHLAYWELFPTIDHEIPIGRGGTNTPDNWITCSMLNNSIKSNWTLENLGWSKLPEGNLSEWDGLIHWFIEQVNLNKSLLDNSYLKRWYLAAVDLTKYD